MTWERCANDALERAGRPERIDRRSLEAQGIDREPGIHVGPKARQLAREDKVPPSRVANDNNGREIRWPEIDGGKSRVDHNRSIKARNRVRSAQNQEFRQAVGKAWQEMLAEQKQNEREAQRRETEAEQRERRLLEKRQARRTKKEAAADERKRPKGIVGFVFKLIGKAAKIEQQIERAQVRRAERDEAEWQRLETRQAEQRAYAAQSRTFFNDLDKRHFRVEARKLHQEITNTKTNLTARDSQSSRSGKPRRYRDDDDGREGGARGKNLGP